MLNGCCIPDAAGEVFPEARRSAFDAGMKRVQGLVTVAIDPLAKLMDRRMPPNVRLGAARMVADLGLHRHDEETPPTIGCH
jgi:hypothetical protein